MKKIILPLVVLYIILLFSVRAYNCSEFKDHTISFKFDKLGNEESITFLKHYKIVTQNDFKDDNISSLYAPEELAKQLITGQEYTCLISPIRCASWLDFFKVFNSKYDYYFVSINK